jgi:hypothetical protein
MKGQVLEPNPFVPLLDTLTSAVVPSTRSRTNTSKNVSVSSGASVFEVEKNVT